MHASLGGWEEIVPQSNDPIEPLLQATLEASVDKSMTIMQLKETFRRYLSAAYMQGVVDQKAAIEKDRKEQAEIQSRKPHPL